MADLGVSGPGEKHSEWAPFLGGGWVRAERENFFGVTTSKPLKVCNRQTPDVTQVADPNFEFPLTFQGFFENVSLGRKFCSRENIFLIIWLNINLIVL